MKDINILAADTSGKILTAAILKNTEPLAFYREYTGLTHSETFMPKIIELFSESGIKLNDIDCFVCVNGPGSFTGLRIGIAAMKALAQVTGKPMAEVSALDGLYMSIKDRGEVICSMIDARREEVYAAVYKNGEKIFGDCSISIAELAEFLKTLGLSAVINGDGAIAYRDRIMELTDNTVVFPEEDKMLQNGIFVGLCGLEKIKRGEITSYDDFSVNYIKPSQPEMKLMKR